MIELIPAIDIMDGKCVRLFKGDYAQSKVYGNDPVALAKEFERIGFKRLHVVDLDGARSKHVINDKVLRKIASATNLIVDFGGGIKSEGDMIKAFDNGASVVTVGSIAATRPDLFCGWIEKFGAERIMLGADVREGKIAVNGWKEDTVQDLLSFLEYYVGKGIKNVLCTDITKDGTLEGPAFGLYRQIKERYPGLWIVASGGVSSVGDIRRLDEEGIPAVVFGKAYYEGRLDINSLKDYV